MSPSTWLVAAEQHLAGADAADHLAAHGDVFGQDLAMDFRLLADHQADAAHIAFDAAVDLHVAGGDQRAGDRQIGADDRGRATARAGALGLRPAALAAAGCGTEVVSLPLLENMAACLYEVARIAHDVVVPDLVMDMRSGAAAGRADAPDRRAPLATCCPPAP